MQLIDKNEYYLSCTLCGRECGINRFNTVGACLESADVRVSRCAPHMWEEPPISGTRGSGTIFLSGCSLGCVFCQNKKISRGGVGRVVSISELADIMLSLEGEGVHNINFVTPTHASPRLAMSIERARALGLKIPIVYNTSSYDSVSALQMLDGLVDIYLADYKFNSEKIAKAYTRVNNYPSVARAAIAEMVRQRGKFIINSEGLMQSGVILRLLLLPTHLIDAKMSLKYLYSTYSDNVYFSLMSQYTPQEGMTPPLDRRVSEREYTSFVEYALALGIRHAFIQEGSSASESFIPDFEY